MCEAMKILMHDELSEAQREGRMEQARETAITLAGMGMPVEKIAEAVRVSLKIVQEWISESVSLAK